MISLWGDGVMYGGCIGCFLDLRERNTPQALALELAQFPIDVLRPFGRDLLCPLHLRRRERLLHV